MSTMFPYGMMIEIHKKWHVLSGIPLQGVINFKINVSSETRSTKELFKCPPFLLFYPQMNNISVLGMVGIFYTWDFGDGFVINVTEPHVSHIYMSSGEYNVTVIARYLTE